MEKDNRNALRIMLAALALAGLAAREAPGQTASAEPDTPPFRILKWTAADQAAWIDATLNKGMPSDQGDALAILAINRTSLALPLIEQKIEQVLQSKSPLDCFTDKSVKPEKFVYLAADLISYAGNDEAMRQVAKLIKLDEKRFGDLVDRTLMETENRGNPENQGNPYIVGYHSLEIDDRRVEKRIYAWAQAQAAEKYPYRARDLRKFWAAAMVTRYGGVPTENQWATDPFISRLKLADEPELHKDIMTYAIAVVEQRAKH